MGNSGSGLAYDEGKSLPCSGYDHWQISSGVKKETSTDVTLFCYKKSSTYALVPAQKHWQRMRTIRHPYILTFLEGIDLPDSIVLATESCIPLDMWLTEKLAEKDPSIEHELLWGFRCILEALDFLHTKANLSHGYLGLHAIYISKNGDWKLGALDLASNLAVAEDLSFAKTYSNMLVRPYISPERMQLCKCSPGDDVENVTKTPQGAADIFSLAHCIQKCFDQLGVEVPSTFVQYTKKMLSVESRRRPTASQLVKCKEFNNDHIQLLVSLGELALKQPGESIEILNVISPKVKDIPPSICQFKILPSVSKALQMAVNDFQSRDSREACRQLVQLSLELLSNMATLGKLEESSFMSQCGTMITQLWALSDRTVRTALLKSLRSLTPLISEKVINNNIFDPILAGFADSNPKLREETLKSLIHVVDKLEERNMQDKLVRCISNLQSDAEASIRTNATVFLGKIAFRLKEGVRNRVLCASFSKAMRDNFVPCRISGLKAATTCITVLDHAQLVSKVLPAVCILIMDRSGEVRELAFAFIEQAVRILREGHEKQLRTERENAEKQTSDSPQKGAQAQSGGWTSWAVDGISKTLEKVTIDGTAPVSASTSNSYNHNNSSHKNSNTNSHATSNTSSHATSNTNTSTNSYKIEKRIDNDDTNDAWGDDDVDWGDDDDGDMNNKNVLPKQKSSSTINTNDDWGGNGWDDDEIIDEDDNKPEVKPATKVTSTFNSNVSVNKSDPFAMMEKESAAPKPIGGLTVSSKSKEKDKKKVAITKLAVSSSDNWDDF